MLTQLKRWWKGADFHERFDRLRQYVDTLADESVQREGNYFGASLIYAEYTAAIRSVRRAKDLSAVEQMYGL